MTTTHLDTALGIIKRTYYVLAILTCLACLLGYFFVDWTIIDPKLLSYAEPPPPGFDFYEAKKAGYSDLEIFEFMKTHPKFKAHVAIEDPMRKIVLGLGVLITPIAYVLHKTTGWIVFGKIR